MSTFTEFTADVESLDPDLWLGLLTYYKVEALSIHHTDLVTAMAEVGLSEFCPPEPNNMDVFRRVSAAGQRKRVPTSDPEQHNNFLIRELAHTSFTADRRIVCETVDLKGRRLAYRELVEVSYDHGKLVVNELVDCTGEDCTMAGQIAEEIEQAYQAQAGSHGDYTVRSLVRRIVLAQSATMLRDGLYFVPAERADKVAALEAFADKVPQVMVHSVPQVNNAKQRAEVRRAFEAESVGEIDKVIAEIVDIVGSGEEISHRKFAAYQERYQGLLSKAGEYKGLLQEGVETTSIRLNILGREMAQLLRRVK